METKVINYYDENDLSHVGTRFFLDNEEVSFEDYRDFVEGVSEESDIEDCCDGYCDNCEIEESVTFDDVINDYVELIQQTGGCDNCIKQLLENFFEEIIDMFEEE